MLERVDTAGRRFANRRNSTGKRTTPRIHLLLPLQTHGPLPTHYLVEFAKHAGFANPTKTKLALRDMYHEKNTPHGAPYLDRPFQQFPTPPFIPRNMTIFSDLTEAGKETLKDAGELQPISHAGSSWFHQAMVACITASIHLGCLKHGFRFISRYEIMGDRDIGLEVEYDKHGNKRRLVPDALFGIEYPGGKRRYYLVEADRGFEQTGGISQFRKSFLRNVAQYRNLIGRKAYKDHFKIDDGIVVLTVTKGEGRTVNMIEVVKSTSPSGLNNYMCFQSHPCFAGNFAAPPILYGLLKKEWLRAGEPFSMMQ